MRVSHKFFALVVVFGCLASCGGGENGAGSSSTETGNDSVSYEEKIEAQMKRDNVPGLQVCYIRKDVLLDCDSFGWAEVDATPMVESSVFLWASVSKLVTAVSQIKAEELGLLDVDSDVNAWLPFPVTNNNGGTITTRSLANHTSGTIDNIKVGDVDLMDTFRVIGYVDPVISLSDAMENYFSRASAFGAPVGQAVDYSNMGAALGGYVVEAATEQDFNVFVNDHIFTPLGMSSSTFRITDVARSDHARHYEGTYNKWNETEFYSFSDYPNGGLRSSARDMSRFLGMVANGGSCNDVRILTDDSVKEMLSLQTQQKGADGFPQLYGFYRDGSDDDAWVGHNGGEENIASEIWFRPSDGIGFAAFTNHEGFTETLKRLLKDRAVELKGNEGSALCPL